MSDVQQKVRILLLDENTGQPITEVDALTSAEVILYTNPNPILQDIGTLQKGTTFNKTPLNTILDGLLYQYTMPTVTNIITTCPDLPATITEDASIYLNRGTTLSGFQYSVTFTAGTQNAVTCLLKVYAEDATVAQQTATFEVVPGQSYSANFDIADMSKTSTIELVLYDNEQMVTAPYIKVSFVDPIFVGFAEEDILDPHRELIDENMTLIHDYFIGLINTEVDHLQRRVCAQGTDQKLFSLDRDYDHKLNANPCILVPHYWGNALAILDMHGNNIINSFSVLQGLNLKVNDQVETVQYLVYMCRQTFDVNSLLMGGITFVFNPATYSNPPIADMADKGMPLTTGFDLNYTAPLDNRFLVDTYEDLITIRFPYEGLITYVEDIDTFFRYGEGHWLPTSTRVFVVDTAEQLTAEIGGWDDVAIDVSTGSIYRKRYNNVWELWGTINGSGGGSCTCQKWVFHEEYNPNFTYRNDANTVDLVYYNGSTYYCKGESVVGVTPSNDKVNWVYFCRGCSSVPPEKTTNIQFYNLHTGEIISGEEVINKGIGFDTIIPITDVSFKEV